MNRSVDSAYGLLYADDGLGQLCNKALLEAPADHLTRMMVLCHLAAPTTPAVHLAEAVGGDLNAVRSAYHYCRDGRPVSQLVESLFYPYRLRWSFAAATVAEWRRTPDRPARILAHEPAIADTVEIHPTRGTCNYRCAMCLWSDQQDLTYTTKQLDRDGVMTLAEWRRILTELNQQGVRRLVVSGGGEALINPDLPEILHTAADLGFEICVYTTGFSMRPGTTLAEALMRCHRIRFSIHSPDASTYERIAGTRPAQRAFDRVKRNVRAILDVRDEAPHVGIGFVIQVLNYWQIERMVEFSEELGVDWLDIRKDEVDVTEGLTDGQLEVVRDQLRRVRSRSSGRMRIDIGDELVSVANGQTVDRSRTTECLARYFRPTIGAYGHYTPCDLQAEPRFAESSFNLGVVKNSGITDVITDSSGRRIPDECSQCMPSSRTGNAVLHKLLADLQAGIGVSEQPFSRNLH